jgi:hypothetical protein
MEKDKQDAARDIDPFQLETRFAECIPALKLKIIENTTSERNSPPNGSFLAHHLFFHQQIDTESLTCRRRDHKRRPQYVCEAQFRICPTLAHRVQTTLQWKEARNVADAAI